MHLRWFFGIFKINNWKELLKDHLPKKERILDINSHNAYLTTCMFQLLNQGYSYLIESKDRLLK